MRKRLLTIFMCLMMLLMTQASAFAHGVKVEYHAQTSYEIIAAYDTGEPMAEAQVIIYAPDDPANPLKTDKCDKEGHYTFTPDLSKPGTWNIQIRQSGHGANVYIEVDEEGAAAVSGGTGYSTLQVIIMLVSVVWGFVGTALYFKRRNQ